MSWEPVWSATARRDLRRLDPPVASRIVDAVLRLAEDELGDVRRLTGTRADEFRLRVGGWRVRFSRDVGERTLTVLRVLHRREAYRD